MLSLALLLVFGVFGIGVSGKLRVVLSVVFGIAFVVCAKYSEWCVYAYRSFSYDGERKLSKQIIDGTAEHITLPEGMKNASFQRGNAVKLDFPDESFDAVTSNYVYHNITGADKQAFVQKLRDMGYERVELIDTTDGSFMTPKEARHLMLRGSTLLVGRK